MNKTVKINGTVYDYVDIISYEGSKYLKLKDVNNKIYYYKADYINGNVNGKIVVDLDLIAKLSNNDVLKTVSTENVDMNPRNKMDNESIENYFKYLDNFYRG